jgi:hypothetical protein
MQLAMLTCRLLLLANARKAEFTRENFLSTMTSPIFSDGAGDSLEVFAVTVLGRTRSCIRDFCPGKMAT